MASSKAIFLGMAGSGSLPNTGNFHVDLFPPDHEVPPLDDRALNALADYFLSRLLQYRLDHAQEVRESQFVAPDLRSPTRQLASKLGACIQGNAQLALQVVPLLRPQDDLVNRCNLDYAIVEILWPRVHRITSNTAVAAMKIEAELTAEVNTFLLSCGKTWQYSREEVGLRVAKFELSRKRTNAGTLLLLDRETSRRVHQLARGTELIKACRDAQTASRSNHQRREGCDGCEGEKHVDDIGKCHANYET